MPFEPDPRFASPEYRADLLRRQRAGKLTVRQLAAQTPGRGRSAIAEDLARARREEQVAHLEAVSAAKTRSQRIELEQRYAGLSANGLATLMTPLARKGYDPLDPEEVERTREYLRDDVERWLLDQGEDPAVASAAAAERGREWKPAVGPK